MATPMMPDNYQAESDADTLMRHQKIKDDPKRHKAAFAHIKGQLATMNSVVGEGKDTKAHEKAEGPKKETAEQKAGTD